MSGDFAYVPCEPHSIARCKGKMDMPDAQKALMELQSGADVLFLLVGAVLVLAMHAGFAFLQAGTVRHKNQVSALTTILVGFALSVVAYFLVGFKIAYGLSFFTSAPDLSGDATGFGPQGLTLAKFVLLAAIAAAVPAIVAGGIAERARLLPHCVAAALVVAFLYPVLEGIVWNRNYGLQETVFRATFGVPFHDFAGSVVVHATGGWLAFSAVRRLGPRLGRNDGAGRAGFPPSSVPWLAVGSWLLCIGWLGFTVMSAHALQGASGLVAMNTLMAMSGGILAALIAGDGDPGFVHNGALAGLVAICAGADVVHPAGALFIGGVAGVVLVEATRAAADPRWKLDDVGGVWALHGLCGVWGGIACGIFGLASFGGMGGVGFQAQLAGSVLGAACAMVVGAVLYAVIDVLIGLRLDPEDEQRGADLAIHKAGANPGDDLGLGRI
jgi:Amt family ammonium transporter